MSLITESRTMRLFDTVMIVGSIQSSALQRKVTQIHGTAWKLAADVIVTAGHVVNGARSTGRLVLGFAENPEAPDSIVYMEANHTEVIEEIDLGLIFCSQLLPCRPLTCDLRPLPLLEDIRTFGFPYGLDPQTGDISIRAFCGSTVCVQRMHHGGISRHGFEMSFHCPRGLSGGPVLRGRNVVGLVQGNKIIEQEIYSEREHDGSNVFLKVEAMHLGVALAAKEILDAKSKHLNTTLRDYLNCAAQEVIE